MHVTFISQCKLKAVGRTARVLDAYALRKGDRTWMSPMTAEGLAALREQLRAVATRQTAVACYLSAGKAGMRLIWTVGTSSGFGLSGSVPVATRQAWRPAERRVAMPPGLRMASLMARASGYAHDFGKAYEPFQRKLLSNTPVADPVRHEWISLQILLQGLLEEKSTSWREAWKSAGQIQSALKLKDVGSQVGLQAGLTSAWASFLYLVFTHHRLPSDGGDSKNGLSGVIDEATYVRDDALTSLPIVHRALPNDSTLDLLRQAHTRMMQMGSGVDPKGPVYWRAVATVARIALILADHSISSINVRDARGQGRDLEGATGALFANTVRDAEGRSGLNQELNWHLVNVGSEAGRMLQRMTSFEPPALSDKVRLGLRATSAKALEIPSLSRFAWQPKNAQVLQDLQVGNPLPNLVFNIAGTGCGKTRGNVLFLDALRQGQPLRFAAGLNLRTLTMQTRDAYAKQLGMGEDDLACVIGSVIAQKLHDSREPQPVEAVVGPDEEVEDEDGNLPEDAFEAIGESDAAPYWLEGFLSKNPKMRAIAMAPALVCTIDFLVKAGDPTQQGNHGLTMLRLIRSDLILDEIDSYDPKGLVAVMRLVTAAAMWGRHVVASSATLSTPVAMALWCAFDLGLRMGHELGILTSATGRQVLIDDANTAAVACHTEADQFEPWYSKAIEQRCQAMGQRQLRPAELIDFAWQGKAPDAAVAAVRESIARACVSMHDRHGWDVAVDGESHRVSFGLVRIANITQAVQTAQHLCAALPFARVACYHAQLSRIHRHSMECVLDGVLQRGGSEDPAVLLARQPQVLDAMRASIREGRSHTAFVVVATPVEEVGRDHDFDWGVFEPSSSQSLVQTAGRINRHRLLEMSEPNVGILRWNYAKVSGRLSCFSKPGLEEETDLYGNQDVGSLVNWASIESAGQIDARLRYGIKQHPLAWHDDQSSERQIKRFSRRFMECSSDLWMGADTYKTVRLRDGDQKDVWTRSVDGRFFKQERVGDRRNSYVRWRKTDVEVVIEPSNAWLSWTNIQLGEIGREIGISPEESLLAEVRPAGKTKKLVFSDAFGYYLTSP
jgi:CRISPR-associated endonuclease/helicase Cas3